MPLISSSYKPLGVFRNTHFATIYSAKLRIAPKLIQRRQRITLKDGDFIDLDFSDAETPSSRIAILLHGLEGNAQRTYIKGQANILVKNGWNACAVNYRGCSGEPNRMFQSYNAGKTDDLEEIVDYLIGLGNYSKIALVGFSLGGNLLLKYLGEGRIIPGEIQVAVAVSAPLSLLGSLEALSKGHNWVYRTSFLVDLRKKFYEKVRRFPSAINASEKIKIRSLLEFDNVYTAPAHGFTDAFDYYEKNSSLQFLPMVKIPTLILNAANDSFLSSHCYPKTLASQSKNIYLETPKYGGHVGFYLPGENYYSEKRVLEFLNTTLYQ
jgi:predicted alpha/beta-fold hydrolase